MFFKGLHGILHGSLEWCPLCNVGKVRRGIAVFFRTLELDRAPEGFDVAQHLTAKRPDAGHPVAVPAPEEVIADESVVFMTGEIHPFG